VCGERKRERGREKEREKERGGGAISEVEKRESEKRKREKVRRPSVRQKEKTICCSCVAVSLPGMLLIMCCSKTKR